MIVTKESRKIAVIIFIAAIIASFGVGFKKAYDNNELKKQEILLEVFNDMNNSDFVAIEGVKGVIVITTDLEQMAIGLEMPYDIAEQAYKDSAIDIYSKVMVSQYKKDFPDIVDTLNDLGYTYLRTRMEYRDGSIGTSSTEKLTND